MEKYRGRRFFLSSIIIIVPQLFLSYLAGLFVSIILQHLILFIIWTDNYDRWWITRFFDPKI
jgi:VIT1/CCC1 family predicted Fe2+/Mn2+ transporter